MRKSNTQSLKDILGDYVEELNLSQKLKELRVIKLWPELMGPAINNVTKDIYIKNGILFVHLTSAAARNELMMRREAIIVVMNKKVGSEVVKKVVLR
ncbi:MAG: DUF721 domain-containing protein [Bacteroidota bacterium]